MTYPEDMTDDLEIILGRMCFQCIHIANLLRESGHTIKTREESEQAAVIHWLLKIYLTHGEKWRDFADDEIKTIRSKIFERETSPGI